MNKIAKILFIGGLAALLVCPLLSLFGVRETWTDLSGFETVVNVTDFSLASFQNREWQKNFTESFAKGFFLRKSCVKLRNEFFELLNFGAFHEGHSRRIFEMSDGALWEKSYITPALDCSASVVAEERHGDVLDKIAELQKLLANRGVDFIFVLAPGKEQLYPADLPWYVNLLLKCRDRRIQDDLIPLLQARRINYLDAGRYLHERYGSTGPSSFPYAGIHWNALGVAAVWNEVLVQMNHSGFGAYAINPFLGVERSSRPWFYEDDLGQLLNLISTDVFLRNVNYEPVYEHKLFVPNDGSLLLWGDSFTHEIIFTLYRSREFARHKTIFCDKRFSSEDEIRAIANDLRLVVFVYTTPHQMELQRLFLEKIEMLRAQLNVFLPPRGTARRMPEIRTPVLPSRKCLFTEYNPAVWPGKGFLPVEPWGVWSEALESHLCVGLPEGPGTLRIGLRPFGHLKWVKVFFENRCLAHWNVEGDAVYDLDCRQLPRGVPVDLQFEASHLTCPRDVLPGNSDDRTLGFGLTFLEWVEARPAAGDGIPELKSEIRFNDKSAKQFLLDGFGEIDPWGVWCVGKRSRLAFCLPETKGTLTLCIRAQCFGDKCRNVRVSHEGKVLAVWDVKTCEPTDYFLDCTSLPRGRKIDLVLEPSATLRPCDALPGSNDKRELSLGLISMKLSPN